MLFLKLNIQRFGASGSVNCQLLSQSIENNTSNVRITFTVKRTSGTTYWEIAKTVTFTCDGQTKSTTMIFPSGSVGATASCYQDFTITHNNDGTKTISYQASINTGTSAGTLNPTNQTTLTTIPRASTPSMGTATTNSAITISISRASTSFTHKLTYAIGNKSGTISTNAGDSASWTPSRDLATQNPNGQSVTGTLTCETFSGGTSIGSKTISITVNIDSGIVPTISNTSCYDSNTTVGGKGWGTLLTTLSHLQVSMSGAGAQGSTIKRYYCEYENQTYYDTSVSGLNSQLRNLNVVAGSNKTCKVWVYDSRDRISSKVSLIYNVTEYFTPVITSYNAQRCLSDGTLDDSGTYLKLSIVASSAAVNDKNSFTVKIGYKKKTESTYTYGTYVNGSTTVHAVDYTGSNTKLIGAGGISASQSYDVEFYISDAFSSLTRNREISTGFDLIHFNKSGKSLAFGKKSEAGPNEAKVEFGMPADFKGGFYVNGADIFNKIYPVGSIYMSTVATNPGTLFGVGTWQQITGRFLWATSSSPNQTGGSQTRTLTAENMPSHNHSIPSLSGWTGGAGGHQHNGKIHTRTDGHKTGNIPDARGYSAPTGGNIEESQITNWVGDHSHSLTTNASETGWSGSGTAFSIMPPYYEVYVWKRTA